MSQNYDCPNCGGAVTFQSSIAVWALCPHCRSMVVRHDVQVEAIGQIAQLPPDMSPLQLGTQGEFDGVGFTLIGRLRLAYEEGSWNEWCALFGDGRYGWIGEAQGFFMASFEVAPPPGFPDAPSAFSTGNVLGIAGQSYIVADAKETACLGGEGELPVVAAPGRKATSIDLGGDQGQFASAEFSGEERRLFVGRYARFDDLKFTNLRAPPGWEEDPSAPKVGGTTALQCPKCGATVELRAAGFTMSAACGSCGSLLDTSAPDLDLIRRAEAPRKLALKIPLGRRGELFGVVYEVIGAQHVDDNFGGWVEYLLFNPWQGFVWLVTYRGHWTFVERLFEQFAPQAGLGSTEAVDYRDETYRIFDKSTVKTDCVLGEFYWKVALGMKTEVADYIRPPQILSRESYPNSAEQTWSHGVYIEPDVVEKAFQVQLPEPMGPYLTQPNPYAEKARQLRWLALAFIMALLLVQIVSATRAARQPVATVSGIYVAAMTNPAVLSPTFDVKGGRQALEYDLTAGVDNSWIELDIDLVNAETHQVAATVEKGVEYYHGYDDGLWSEGRVTERVVVPAVPAGKYYLTIESSADPKAVALPYTVSVVRDVVIWSNFWIALSVLAAYPFYCGMRAYLFENARWQESDFAPSFYYTGGGDDDNDDD